MADDRQLAVDELCMWIEENPDEFREGIDQMERNLRFALAHMDEWRQEHPNHWAAVSKAKLVAMDSSQTGLLEALRAKRIEPVDAYVFFVHDKNTSLAL